MKKYVPTSQASGTPRTCAPVTGVVIKFDRPASPVTAAFGSVRLNERAVVQFTITNYVPSAPLGIHVSAVFEQIVNHVVFREEEFIAAPVRIFRPGTVTIFLAIVGCHSHYTGLSKLSEGVETVIHHAIYPSEGIDRSLVETVEMTVADPNGWTGAAQLDGGNGGT